MLHLQGQSLRRSRRPLAQRHTLTEWAGMMWGARTWPTGWWQTIFGRCPLPLLMGPALAMKVCHLFDDAALGSLLT